MRMTEARSVSDAAAHAKPANHHPGSMEPPRIADYFVRVGCDPLTEAFMKRSFSPPWRGSRPVDAEDVEAVLRQIYATPREQAAVAYLHVPYCQNHCLFCGFFQNVWRPEVAADYVDDVIAELASKADSALVASAPIDAVYIGGGTPSALPEDQMVRLVRALHDYLPLTPDCEITMEGRSFGFAPSKAIAVADAGVTRLSIGVQSFASDVRRRLGRKLNGDDVKAFLAELVALRRTVVVCDLIYGLPGQSAEDWRRDIEIVNEIGLDGVTLYALNVFPGGPLSRAIAGGKLPAQASTAVQARAYADAVDRLEAYGWLQVSQSHMVRSTSERNRYNSAIKRGAPCLPFGPGAGGQAQGYRWRNIINVAERRQMQAAQRAPIEGLAMVPAHHGAHATIAAGLEAGQLDLAVVEALRPGFRAAVAPLLANWAAAGLGELSQHSFKPSRAGAFWIGNLTSGLSAGLENAPTAPLAHGCT